MQDRNFLDQQQIPLSEFHFFYENRTLIAAPVAYSFASPQSAGGIYFINEFLPSTDSAVYTAQVSAAIVGKNLPIGIQMNLAEILLSTRKLASHQMLVYQALLHEGIEIQAERVGDLPGGAPVVKYFPALLGTVI